MLDTSNGQTSSDRNQIGIVPPAGLVTSNGQINSDQIQMESVPDDGHVTSNGHIGHIHSIENVSDVLHAVDGKIFRHFLF